MTHEGKYMTHFSFLLGLVEVLFVFQLSNSRKSTSVFVSRAFLPTISVSSRLVPFADYVAEEKEMGGGGDEEEGVGSRK